MFYFFFYLVDMILSCYIILMFGQNQDHTMRCDVRWPGWSSRVCEAIRKNVEECTCMWDWLRQQAYGYVSRQNNHAVHCDVQNMGWWLPPQNPEEAFCCAWWIQAHNEEMCEYSFFFAHFPPMLCFASSYASHVGYTLFCDSCFMWQQLPCKMTSDLLS